MAVLILALVVTIITGAHYFGRNVTRPLWLSNVHFFGVGVTPGINRLRTLGI